MYCKYCDRDLSEDMFYVRKDNGYKERICRDCKNMKAKDYRLKNKDRIKAINKRYWYKRNNSDRVFKENLCKIVLGGCKCYILNHTKVGEYYFNIVTTDGEVLKTNSFAVFLSFINKYKNLG